VNFLRENPAICAQHAATGSSLNIELGRSSSSVINTLPMMVLKRKCLQETSE